MLAATTHLGSSNSETTMEQYIFKKKNDGVNIINLKVDFYLIGVRGDLISLLICLIYYCMYLSFSPFLVCKLNCLLELIL